MSTLKNSMLELAAKFDDNYNTGLIKSFMFGLNKTEIKTMTDILSRYKFRDSHAPQVATVVYWSWTWTRDRGVMRTSPNATKDSQYEGVDARNAKSSQVGVVLKFGEKLPADVLSSSLDYVSNVQNLSSKASCYFAV
ncbi:hypothetical protein TNCV_738141 [Trichonephila clavipes]|nr:hypothetical protein TNCV_738141 [Trichonephila clavipes]